MYSYALLEPGCHYLVQEKEDTPVLCIKIIVESDHCLFVEKYEETPTQEWKRKNEPLFDILECLSDEKVKEWETAYNDNQESYYEEEDDD
jgi:hypothetical protein